MSDDRDFAFPSTGDPAEDERTSKGIMICESRMQRNICPNGCGSLTFIDFHNRECPVCHFHGWESAPIKLKGEKVQ